MKNSGNIYAVCYCNTLRQNRVKAAQKFFAVNIAFCSEIAAEHICVNSGIGAAARNRLNFLAEYLLCGGSELTLNSAKPGLKLVAVEAASVIHKCQFNVSHNYHSLSISKFVFLQILKDIIFD